MLYFKINLSLLMSLVLYMIGFSLLTSFYLYPMNISHNEKSIQPIIEQIKRATQAPKKVPPFVAIAGGSAVGKSYFADILKKLLKKDEINAKILKGDDFLNPDHFDSEHFHPRLEYKLMHLFIQQIKEGKQLVRKPAWDLELMPPAKIEEEFSIKDVDIVLFEGEFTLCDDEPYDFSKYSEFGIFLDANDEDIVEWNWQRKRDVEEGETREAFVAKIKPGLKKYRSYIQSSMHKIPRFLVLQDRHHQYKISNF